MSKSYSSFAAITLVVSQIGSAVAETNEKITCETFERDGPVRERMMFTNLMRFMDREPTEDDYVKVRYSKIYEPWNNLPGLGFGGPTPDTAAVVALKISDASPRRSNPDDRRNDPDSIRLRTHSQ